MLSLDILAEKGILVSTFPSPLYTIKDKEA